MRGIFIGIGIFILAGIIGFAFWYKGHQVTVIHLKGIIGSEKSNFLENEKVRRILLDKYGINIDYTRAGSIEMVNEPVKDDIDFLWPSSQVALEIFKNNQGGKLLRSELIFNSPIVIYSWDIVVSALVKQQVVRIQDSTYFLADMPKLISWELGGKSWPDIGLPELYGKINVITTDPTKSNSGNMYAGLMANILYGDVVNNEDSMAKLIPNIRELFARQGFMQSSSGFLFEQFLKTGVGQYPMIAGYENQIIEFADQHPDFWPKVKNKIKILYPVPTVWSEHPLLVLHKNAFVLVSALKDPEIQKIAWEQHGFRTGLAGVDNDSKQVRADGVAETITKVMPMPRAGIMEKIIAILSEGHK